MPDEINVSVPALAEIPKGEQDDVLREAAPLLEEMMKGPWFNSEGRGRWPKSWIVPGIVQDLNDSPNIKQRQFYPSKQTGVGTGRMRDSINVTFDGEGISLKVGTDYAEKYHKGGQSQIVFTEAVVRNLRIWYGKARTRNRQIVMDNKIGWMFGMQPGRVISFTQKPRPLFTKELIEQVIRLVARRWQYDEIKKERANDGES